jgi:hypothetical protein
MANKSIRYGNDNYWCFIEEGWNNKEIAIWKGPENQEEIIAKAPDKYAARQIVDALLAFKNVTQGLVLDKKELTFLEFVKSTCPEPYATMAANAIMWNDKEVYKKLLSEFNVIYS